MKLKLIILTVFFSFGLCAQSPYTNYDSLNVIKGMKVQGVVIRNAAHADTNHYEARRDSNSTGHFLTLNYAIALFAPIAVVIDTSVATHKIGTQTMIGLRFLKSDSNTTKNPITLTYAINNYSPIAGSSSIVTVGTLTAGTIGSGFTAIDTTYIAMAKIEAWVLAHSSPSSPDTTHNTFKYATKTDIKDTAANIRSTVVAKTESYGLKYGQTTGAGKMFYLDAQDSLRVAIFYFPKDITLRDSLDVNTSIKTSLWVFPDTIVIDTLYTRVGGGSSPSVTVKLMWGTDISQTGTALKTSPSATTGTTTLTKLSSFDHATIPGGQTIWLTCTAVSGFFDYISSTLEIHICYHIIK